MSAIILTTRPDGVAVLTFNQPGKANVLTQELWTEFGNTLGYLAKNPNVKGLVLASAKPDIFIAGADLKLLANATGPDDPAVRAFIDQGLRVLEQLENLPFPTCAAVDGAALGGGLEVVLACDYCVCSKRQKVQFGLPEVKLGLIPGWGGTQRLPRIVGMEKAAKMLMSGASMIAEAAEVAGLAGIEDVPDLVEVAAQFLLELQVTAGVQAALGGGPVWRDERENKRQPVPTSLQDMVTTVTSDAPLAVRLAIRVMVEGSTLQLHEGLEVETAAFMQLAGSGESKRLIAEFFASRKK